MVRGEDRLRPDCEGQHAETAGATHQTPGHDGDPEGPQAHQSDRRRRRRHGAARGAQGHAHEVRLEADQEDERQRPARGRARVLPSGRERPPLRHASSADVQDRRERLRAHRAHHGRGAARRHPQDPEMPLPRGGPVLHWVPRAGARGPRGAEHSVPGPEARERDARHAGLPEARRLRAGQEARRELGAVVHVGRDRVLHGAGGHQAPGLRHGGRHLVPGRDDVRVRLRQAALW
mmetsp:Transcript_42432/g.120027  ORF Transcript_42432/g.120027 Transcript_42432/m.120027 type:complete len:234 (+) Transcript_42432:1693-2394(+)